MDKRQGGLRCVVLGLKGLTADVTWPSGEESWEGPIWRRKTGAEAAGIGRPDVLF